MQKIQQIKTAIKKNPLPGNGHMIKKSTIFIQFGWYSSNFTYSWVSHFHQVSYWLSENCRFFINGPFLGRGNFFVYLSLSSYCALFPAPRLNNTSYLCIWGFSRCDFSPRQIFQWIKFVQRQKSWKNNPFFSKILAVRIISLVRNVSN